MVTLVDLTEWKNLPNISQWVLQILENGYRIQFGPRSPCYKEGVAHFSASRAGSGNGARSKNSISKGNYRAGVFTRQRIVFLWDYKRKRRE